MKDPTVSAADVANTLDDLLNRLTGSPRHSPDDYSWINTTAVGLALLDPNRQAEADAYIRAIQHQINEIKDVDDLSIWDYINFYGPHGPEGDWLTPNDSPPPPDGDTQMAGADNIDTNDGETQSDGTQSDGTQSDETQSTETQSDETQSTETQSDSGGSPETESEDLGGTAVGYDPEGNYGGRQIPGLRIFGPGIASDDPDANYSRPTQGIRNPRGPLFTPTPDQGDPGPSQSSTGGRPRPKNPLFLPNPEGGGPSGPAVHPVARQGGTGRTNTRKAYTARVRLAAFMHLLDMLR
jgi:hypothetical protein